MTTGPAPLFFGIGFAAREAVCGCSECGGLDVKHPREGQQLRLRILDPENRARATVLAGARMRPDQTEEHVHAD